ncbi:hypothetical protein TWF694_004765 [Orbilia ellipsospora]|uniref:Uncharacterized protein n=1 Tax=Orbilia ellipsospora TaxID=2528407 RepID=A0AAV9WYC1_9PEZI
MKFSLISILAATAIARPIADNNIKAADIDRVTAVGLQPLTELQGLERTHSSGSNGDLTLPVRERGIAARDLVDVSIVSGTVGKDGSIANVPRPIRERSIVVRMLDGIPFIGGMMGGGGGGGGLPLPIRRRSIVARMFGSLPIVGGMMGGNEAGGGGGGLPLPIRRRGLIAKLPVQGPLLGTVGGIMGDMPIAGPILNGILKRRQFKIPGLGAGMAPKSGKAPHPIDIIGPVFAVPAEGVSIAGDAINSGAGMGGGGGRMGKGLLPGMRKRTP